jgi:hypothetical protein
VQSGAAGGNYPCYDPSVTNPGAERGRLLLQFERHVLAQARLRLLLMGADRAVADDRQALRVLNARVTRRRVSKR